MILIADSGSTKTDWVLINKTGKFSFKTIGYNPYFINTENIYHSIAETLVPYLDTQAIKNVFFYGAGCSNDLNEAIVKRALSRCFMEASIQIGHDMLAAARALLGNQRGFAAIIGTGSNTCIYNGRDIERNIDSLGYLLGDEGSGSYIGKKLVRDFLRGYLPRDLDNKFREEFKLESDDIFDLLYNKPLPNRFLAGFCMFADENKEHEYIRKIVRNAFRDFFEHLVSKYPDYREHCFNCVGSVAYIFKDLLTGVADEYGMSEGKLLNSPIDQLVEYHIRYHTV